MRLLSPWFAVLPLCLCLALPACANEDAGDEPASESAATAGGAMEGLTPEQIELRAEPMTPEMAESLGIVDTTIHMEPFPGDTVLRRDTIPR